MALANKYTRLHYHFAFAGGDPLEFQDSYSMKFTIDLSMTLSDRISFMSCSDHSTRDNLQLRTF